MVEYLPSKQAAAGSSPVFRSMRTAKMEAPLTRISKQANSQTIITNFNKKWRHGQVVRQEPAKLLPPVRIWVPPFNIRNTLIERHLLYADVFLF